MCACRRLMAKLVILVAIEDTSISTFFRNFKGRLKSLDYVCLKPFGLNFRAFEMVVIGEDCYNSMSLVWRSVTSANIRVGICQCVILCSMVKTMIRLRTGCAPLNPRDGVRLLSGYAPLSPRDGGSGELINESFVHSWPAIPKGAGLAKRNQCRNSSWRSPKRDTL